MKKVLMASTGVIIVVAAVFLLLQKETSFDPDNYDAAADRQSLLSEIDKLGAEKAYAQFVHENAEAPLGLQHLRAHIVGEALYEHLGTAGIAVCDTSFGFGCFHGLFGIGFATEGIPFVSQADAMCVERFGPLGTGCQHGIGHGIVEYIGHGNVNDALALCEDTTEEVPLLGCSSGVFMEYNTPLIVLPGEDPLGPKEFNESAPYGPCDNVPEKYRASCYYELAPWWAQVLAEDWEYMGRLCDDLNDEEARKACALGIGNAAGSFLMYDIEKAKAACDAAPRRIVAHCRAGAAWSMFSNPTYREQALLMCADMPSAQKQVCERSYDLSATNQ